MAAAFDVLDLWFAPANRSRWFIQDAAFEQLVRDRLLGLQQQAVANQLDSWRATAHGSLALVLLFDQVPRILFRGSARAFATDQHALALAHAMIDQAMDLTFRVDRRLFVYLPFEHAESLDEQRLSEFLIRTRIGRASYLEIARRHLQIIERFGRFPHRNPLLGRTSTAEELAYLEALNEATSQ